jgi:hypothetical protein
MYSGELTKDGTQFSVTIVQADSQTHAMSLLTAGVSYAEQVGFTGDYTSSTRWAGKLVSDGTPLSASIFVTGNEVISIFAQ